MFSFIDWAGFTYKSQFLLMCVQVHSLLVTCLLLLSFYLGPKVITLSRFHCRLHPYKPNTHFYLNLQPPNPLPKNTKPQLLVLTITSEQWPPVYNDQPDPHFSKINSNFWWTTFEQRPPNEQRSPFEQRHPPPRTKTTLWPTATFLSPNDGCCTQVWLCS